MKLTTRDIILIGLFTALMVVGAHLKIPNPLLPMVPITLQLFFCIYSGLLLGAYKGMLSQIVYIIIGLIGIPVFALGGGLSYVLNPTFGYIIGFVLCAFVIGKMTEKMETIKLMNILGAAVVGLILAYIVGNVYMYFIKDLYLVQETSLLGITKAMLPFMLKDLLLTIIAALSSTMIIPALRKAGYVTVGK